MTRVAAVVLMISVGLGACQGTATTSQPTAAMQEDLTRLKADRDARRISYTEWAERTRAAARSSVPLSPEQEAAMEYRTQLARRVDAGDLTEAQFDQESARTLQRLKGGKTAS
ncbi:hypothetical protein FV226_24145 [Methylobacterium sp. WL12]|uniref:hypothetical protein n=1 Tax=Methylobacterium sp. WL12 TaxID=2603890 RepID=UPI0011CAAE2C|nr:hypothetical protein [Methylobacterium sp. WL12]TXM65996.1 hypothetical protein FV226_24145 [Methylobacterium sp. WL12]